MNATEVWDALDDGWKASLEEAWQSWCDGSAGVGAAIVDRHGAVVARNRNRRHDPWKSDGLAGSRHRARGDVRARVAADRQLHRLHPVHDVRTVPDVRERDHDVPHPAGAVRRVRSAVLRPARLVPVVSLHRDPASRAFEPRRPDRGVRARAPPVVARVLVPRRRLRRAARNGRAAPPRGRVASSSTLRTSGRSPTAAAASPRRSPRSGRICSTSERRSARAPPEPPHRPRPRTSGSRAARTTTRRRSTTASTRPSVSDDATVLPPDAGRRTVRVRRRARDDHGRRRIGRARRHLTAVLRGQAVRGGARARGRARVVPRVPAAAARRLRRVRAHARARRPHRRERREPRPQAVPQPLGRRDPHPPGRPRPPAARRADLAEGRGRDRLVRVGLVPQRDQSGAARHHRAGDRSRARAASTAPARSSSATPTGCRTRTRS